MNAVKQYTTVPGNGIEHYIRVLECASVYIGVF